MILLNLTTINLSIRMSNREEEKKKFEKQAAEQYLKFVGISHTLLESGESPDFRLRHNNKHIYLEHTLLMNRGGNIAKGRESDLKKLVHAAKELYEKRYPERPVSVNLQFDYKVDISGSKKKLVVEELVECIANYNPPNNAYGTIYPENNLRMISEIEVFLFPKWVQHQWHFDDIRLYGPLKKEEFVKPVEQKNNKALKVNWKEEFDEAWLLLHAGEKHASYADYDVPEEWISSDWIFSRIIIYDSFGDNDGVRFFEVVSK
jgi:hypothetical protein